MDRAILFFWGDAAIKEYSEDIEKEIVEDDSKKNDDKRQNEKINKDEEAEGNDKTEHVALENKQNSFKVSIADSTDSSKLVTIKKNDYEISWSIIGGQGKTELKLIPINELLLEPGTI